MLQVGREVSPFIAMRSQSAFIWASLVVCIAIFASESTIVYEQIDDAFISFQYAANFVAGHGLVFNVGERVEGYTNLLWVLLIALGIKVGVNAELVAHFLGFFCGCVLLLAGLIYSKTLLPRNHLWLAGLAPPVLLSSNSFSCWTASGLETPLFAALIVLALIAHANSKVGWITFFCIMATLTRPDGVIAAGVLLGLPLVVRVVQSRSFRVKRELWSSIAMYSLFLACLTLFRIVYYGSYIPNTFYAKVGGISFDYTITYVTTFIKDGPGWLLLLFPFALMSKSFSYGAVLFTAFFAYILVVGGDVFMCGRFFLPVLPIMIAGALIGGSNILRHNRVAGGTGLVLIPLTICWNLYGSWHPFNGEQVDFDSSKFTSVKRIQSRSNLAVFETTADAKHKIAQLNLLVPPVKTVALIGIGRIAFYSDFTIVDVLGLVDPHIAHSTKLKPGVRIPGHQRTDADYVFSRNPDVIFIPRKDDPNVLVLPAVQDLWDNPTLEKRYFFYEPDGPYLNKKYASAGN